ncbi:hypothetical protein [Hyalangium rubrum]|uniref:DUF2914 domain-containing protein n=1 Tax=Hyalangium rubrum TaxID=3103134 RepID=A0ABU5GZ95_9BACT|nr:hypothetical protein [Hyalangium sp. s54d21]MDY7225867.1 hypothetical protein [Hyalangium sp. s54d21]
MKKMLTRSAVFAALTLSSVALAQEAEQAAAPTGAPVTKPTADGVKNTWDYFYRGQGQGPVLIEAKLCTEVGKEGANKYECTAEVDMAAGVKSGTSVMLWQAYLVPQGDSYEDIMVQVKQGNTVRETKDVKVKGDGWRARQWTGVRLNKPGSWTVSVMRGDQTLKELQVKVN